MSRRFDISGAMLIVLRTYIDYPCSVQCAITRFAIGGDIGIAFRDDLGADFGGPTIMGLFRAALSLVEAEHK